MAKLSTDELLDAFKEMTLIELSEFVKQFEETFDVTAAAPVAVAAAPAAGGAAPAGPNTVQAADTGVETLGTVVAGLLDNQAAVDAARPGDVIQVARGQHCGATITKSLTLIGSGWPTIVGCAGALLIIIAAVATPIAKTQRAREVWFYVMSSGAVMKIVTMELARILMK